nr:PREDICTED: uncharacterized protein LOC107397877 isoform X1 [Tribolium castaneum]|eukprot:XP_015835150.1 PREDICTED: uncharacterized protein LOC107397877 isoform X1 [Tribolium castaneum]
MLPQDELSVCGDSQERLNFSQGQDDTLDSRLRMTSLVESKYVPAIDWWTKTPGISLRMRPKKKICIKEVMQSAEADYQNLKVKSRPEDGVRPLTVEFFQSLI